MRNLFLILGLVLSAVFAQAQEAPAGGAVALPATPAPQAESAESVSNRTDRVVMLMDAGAQYADAGEYAEAERAYLRALESDPENGDIQFRLGTLYIQMGQYEKAVPVLETLLKTYPESPEVNNNLAWVYATGGKMKNGVLALRHAREALLSVPMQPSAWNTLAEAHYMLGQYDEALRASEFAIDLLRLQNGATEDDLNAFQMQYQKILRARDSYKTLLKLNEDK